MFRKLIIPGLLLNLILTHVQAQSKDLLLSLVDSTTQTNITSSTNHLLSEKIRLKGYFFAHYITVMNNLKQVDLKADTLPFQSMITRYGKQFNAMPNQVLTGFKKELNPLNDIYKTPLVFQDAEMFYSNIQNSSWLEPGSTTWYGNLEVNSSWSVAMIPVEFQINNQHWNDAPGTPVLNYNIHFDRENYLDVLKNKMKHINPKDFFEPGLDSRLEKLKTAAENTLKKDLDNINRESGNLLTGKLKDIGDLKGLLTKDIKELRQQLTSPEFIKSIEEKSRLLATLINKKNTGKQVSNDDIKQLEKEISALKGAQQIIATVEQHQNKWANSATAKKIKQLDLLNRQQLAKFVKDPATTISLARQQLNLNSLQKLFLKINKLNLGQNSLSTTPLSLNHLLSKGINTEFLNNNKYLMLGLGKIKNINSITDQPFENNLTANDGQAKMISVGKGSNKGAHTHLSVMSFDQSFNQDPGIAALDKFRNTVVTTISNQLDLGENGIISVEISRSATSYRNNATADSTLQDKNQVQRILSGSNLLDNMAIAVRYEDELVDKNLSYGVHFNKTAMGYINPGNSFLHAGGKEAGFKIRKSLWKNKLQVSWRTELREFDYSNDGDKKWRNSYSVLDIRLRLKKGNSVGIRYMPNRMKRVEAGLKQTVTALDRLAVDGSISQKIGGLYYRNSFNLAWQKNRYLWSNEIMQNNTLTIAGFQSVVIKRNLVYLNTSYDYSDNNAQVVYFNSSFLAEAGTTYRLFNKISLSSAVSYNSVSQWYRQLGFKQTLSGEINKRFMLDAHIDLRTNLKVYQPLWYGLLRADVTAHYLIGK